MIEGWAEIDVTIEGTTPLLMHNPESMQVSRTGLQPKIPTPEEEAARCRYLSSDKKYLVLYDKHIKMCMVNGSKGMKTARGKRSLVPFISSQVRIAPHEIVLMNSKHKLTAKDYHVDTQGVIVQRSRIFRSRARIWPWRAELIVRYHAETFPEDVVLKEILNRAGMFVGLLDYRPQKYGENGQFEVTTWKPRR